MLVAVGFRKSQPKPSCRFATTFNPLLGPGSYLATGDELKLMRKIGRQTLPVRNTYMYGRIRYLRWLELGYVSIGTLTDKHAQPPETSNNIRFNALLGRVKDSMANLLQPRQHFTDM